MDKELQKYYEERFSMMATDGWRDLMEDIKQMQDSVDNLLSVPDEKTLFFRKGQLDILMWVSTLKDTSSKSYEQLMSGDSADGS